MWRRLTVAVAAAVLGVVGACSVSLDGLSGGAEDGGAATARSPDGAPAATTADASDGGPPCVLPPNADVASDPHNCGACGRDCLGGTCTSGRCGVAVLASGYEHPLGVATGGGKLYVSHAGGIDEMDLDGKNRRTVVSGFACSYVVATDTDVYFSEHTNGSIRHWPRSGGPTDVVVPNLDTPLDLALTPDHLYFNQYTDPGGSPGTSGGLYRVTYPGFAAKEQVLSYDHPEGVEWRDGTLWVGSDYEDDVIEIDPASAPRVVFDGGGPVDIGVQGGDLFVSRQGAGEVVRLTLDGGAVELLARRRQAPSGIVATPTALYWAENGAGQVVVLVRSD